MNTLENKRKSFEQNLKNKESNPGNESSLKFQCYLDYIYEQKLRSIKIRSIYDRYEDGKS